jgi:hypothetical protein
MTLGKYTAIVGFAVVSFLGVAVPLASAQGHNDQSSESSDDHGRTIVGAWRTVVTLRNCQTDAALGSLHGLFTFNDGGTMAEYGIGPGQSPALRSPGHGAWQREHGWQNFSFTFTYLRYDASGVFLGSQRVRAAARLGGDGDQIATRSIIEILDVNDVVIGGGCGTAVGTRFE